VEAAGGIDHLIYGWVFFALVIVAVLILSWRFFDRGPDDPLIDVARLEVAPLLARLQRPALPMPLAIAGAILLVSGGKVWSAAAGRLVVPMPARIELAAVPGWHRVDYAPRVPWEPLAKGAAHHLLGSYADGAGHQVDVFFALYASQQDGRKVGGYGQGALIPNSSWAWVGEGPTMLPAKSERLMAGGRIERLALTYFHSGDLTTGSNLRLKLMNIKDQLWLRPRATMVLIISAEQGKGRDSVASLAAFRAVLGDVGAWMDRIAAGR